MFAADPASGAPEVVWRGPANNKTVGQQTASLVQKAAQVLVLDWLPPDEPLEPITVVEAPLRDRLVQSGGGVLLVSDRLFEVFPLLDGFHEREVTRGTFELLVRRSRAVTTHERGDAAWIAEALAWIAVEDWDKKH